jgi:hypothetical protein
MLVTDRLYLYFPQTIDVLSKIKGITLAYFSVLSPNTVIPLHSGDTNATYRLHLGIDIPDTSAEKCGLTVGGITRGWEMGKTLAFSDAHIHSAHNHTGSTRVVLIVDVLKEERHTSAFLICASTLASLGISRLAGPFPFIRQFPKRMMRTFHFTMTVLFTVVLFVNRLVYFKHLKYVFRPAMVRHRYKGTL